MHKLTTKPRLIDKLVPPNFKEASVYGAFVYCYLRRIDSQNGRAGSPYYIGVASYAKRPIERSHRCPVPRDRARIRILRPNLSYKEAQNWEVFYIQKYGRIDNGTGILRNLTNGGEGGLGRIKSAGELEKILESRAKRASDKYGYQLEEWRCLSPKERSEVNRQAKSCEAYGYTVKQWRELDTSFKASLGGSLGLNGDGPGVQAAKKYEVAYEIWHKLSPKERSRWGEQYLTAQKNNYNLADWMRLTNAERQSIGRLRLAAEELGVTVEFWSSLTQSERRVYTLQAEHAERHSVSLKFWQGMTPGQRNQFIQRDKMMAAACKYRILPEVWMLLNQKQRRHINVLNKRKSPSELIAKVLIKALAEAGSGDLCFINEWQNLAKC